MATDDKKAALAKTLAAVPTAVMDTRKKKLDASGAKKTGGMFDIIFKKRMERQKQMQEIASEM